MTKQKDKGKSMMENVGEKQFAVGDVVDVLCDHNEDDNRVRDWLQGVVVQVDEKLVAVQFTEDVYLTDGWMVPDRVLWCQHGADIIRSARRRRRRKK